MKPRENLPKRKNFIPYFFGSFYGCPYTLMYRHKRWKNQRPSGWTKRNGISLSYATLQSVVSPFDVLIFLRLANG